MCLYPKQIKNKKYVANKKNNGKAPTAVDKRALTMPAECGNCIECRKHKARDWQVRLLEDIKENKNGKMITLTLSDQAYTLLAKEFKNINGYLLDNKIITLAVHRFRERWRKEFKKSIRHWLISELGHENTENIHLHGIVWTNESYQKIRHHWQYGWIYPRTPEEERNNYVNNKTINYCIKYVNKIDHDHKEYKPIILTSAAIGKHYLTNGNWITNRYKDKDTKEYYKTETGHKISLPKYYRRKLYTDEQREKLWMNILDKETRYIMGEKIPTGIKHETDHYKTLEYYRKLNKELGYGDDTSNQEQKELERERRMKLQKIRIAKANTSLRRG